MASRESVIKVLGEIDMAEFEDEYECVGIRVQEDSYGQRVGDVMDHNSRVWIDGDETEEELDGVCAIKSNMTGVACEYFGNTVLVLGSNCYTYGEDAGEVIMQEPTVLAIIEL